MNQTEFEEAYLEYFHMNRVDKIPGANGRTFGNEHIERVWQRILAYRRIKE